jgi:hypothetical protein
MIRSVPTTPSLTPVRTPIPRPRKKSSTVPVIVLGVGAVMVALAAVASWFTSAAFDRSLTRLDEQALRQAGVALDKALEAQRAQALSLVRLLADDNRVRATVITPKFDEATVRDVLDDLRQASKATVMAVLDVNGKVGAVSGLDALKKETLGQTGVVKAAMEKASADVWSFPDRVLVIALAPVLSGNQVAALMMVGFEVGAGTLAAVEQSVGVAGALVVADKIVARSNGDGALARAFEAARTVAEGQSSAVESGGQFLVRVTRTGESAAGARAVWLVGQHHQAGLFGPVPHVLWMPAFAVLATALAMLLLSIVWTRR